MTKSQEEIRTSYYNSAKRAAIYASGKDDEDKHLYWSYPPRVRRALVADQILYLVRYLGDGDGITSEQAKEFTVWLFEKLLKDEDHR